MKLTWTDKELLISGVTSPPQTKEGSGEPEGSGEGDSSGAMGQITDLTGGSGQDAAQNSERDEILKEEFLRVTNNLRLDHYHT